MYTMAAAASCLLACSGTPLSVREYAAALPARADGQYAVLDAPIKKQLILMDALLPCAIDVADKKRAEDSAACQCSKSTSADWTTDCKAWLGNHVPGAEGPKPDPATGSSTDAGTGAGSN